MEERHNPGQSGNPDDQKKPAQGSTPQQGQRDNPEKPGEGQQGGQERERKPA